MAQAVVIVLVELFTVIGLESLAVAEPKPFKDNNVEEDVILSRAIESSHSSDNHAPVSTTAITEWPLTVIVVVNA